MSKTVEENGITIGCIRAWRARWDGGMKIEVSHINMHAVDKFAENLKSESQPYVLGC